MTHQRRYKNAVPLRTVTNGSSSGTYIPNWIPVRPGSQDHEKIPSRMGDMRIYRDGRREAA